jgi:hypothetical protein
MSKKYWKSLLIRTYNFTYDESVFCVFIYQFLYNNEYVEKNKISFFDKVNIHLVLTERVF